MCETNDPHIFKEKINNKYLDLQEITKRINSGLDIIGRNENYKPIKLDERFPDFITKNKKDFEKWIFN